MDFRRSDFQPLWLKYAAITRIELWISFYKCTVIISLLALVQAKALKLQPISFEINRNGKLHDTHIIWSNRCRPKGERWLSMEGYIVLYTQIICLQKWLNNIHFEALQCNNGRYTVRKFLQSMNNTAIFNCNLS